MSHNPYKGPEEHDSLGHYFKNNIRETITYVLLVVGLIMLFFNPLIGGIIVGIVAGIYFGEEIIAFIVDFKNTLEFHAIPRNLVLAGVGIAFLISAPAIFLGAALSIGIKQLFVTKS